MNYLPAHLSQRLVNNEANLTEISVRRLPLTRISNKEIGSIVSSLTYNTHVKSVEVSLPETEHTVTDTDEDTDFSAVRDNETCIKGDSKSKSSNNSSSYGYLQTMLQSNTTIDTLTVHQIDSGEAWMALCAGLERNSTIRTLTLGDIAGPAPMTLSHQVCQALGTLLASTTSALVHLTIRNVSIPDVEAMEELATGFSQNHTLQTLTVQQIESDHIPLLLELLASTPAPLEELSLTDLELDCCSSESNDDYSSENDDDNDDDNDNGDVDDDGLMFHPLTSIATNLRHLKKLRVCECVLGESELPALCEGMEDSTSIRLLDLTGNDLLGDAAQSIARMLTTNTALEHLVLEENILGAYGATGLALGLAHNHSLQSLNLTANHIEGDIETLARAVKDSQLQALSLSENPLGDGGAVAVADMLHDNGHLRSLNLDACMMSNVGLASIFDGLAAARSDSSSTVLTDLNLRNNLCTQSSAESLTTMLTHNTTLCSLDLSSCHVSDETLRVIMSSFKDGSNTTLQQLLLSFNSFGNAGAQHIADALQGGHCKLSTLLVQFNAFDETGLQCMAQALRHNKTLQSFYFWNGSKSIDSSRELLGEIDHWLALNRAGRRALVECPQEVLWPSILKRADAVHGADALFYLLREMPGLMMKNDSVLL